MSRDAAYGIMRRDLTADRHRTCINEGNASTVRRLARRRAWLRRDPHGLELVAVLLPGLNVRGIRR